MGHRSRLFSISLCALAATLPVHSALAVETDPVGKDDLAKLLQMRQHFEGIDTAMKWIARVEKSDPIDRGQLSRLLESRQAEMDALEVVITDYFLGNRLKHSADASDPAHRSRLRLLHEILAASTRLNQPDAPADCQQLGELIDDFRESYRQPDGGAASETIVTPAPTAPATPAAPATPTEPATPDNASDSTSEGSGVTEPADPELDAAEQYIVKFTNAYRQRRGLPALKFDAGLSKASREHSGDMNRLGFFSHRSPIPGRTRFTDRAKKFDTTAAAENIAQGAQDGKSALGLWLNSQYHRENILGNYRRIGVGRQGGYYTQMFGR